MVTKLTDRKAKPLIDNIISDMVLQTPFPLFSLIEIETINRCNSRCSFCPVNRHIDPRPLQKMSEELFCSILEQLADINYRGAVSLFSNNEPLLDNRICEFARIARKLIPHAYHYLFTNGTLLTVENFSSLVQYLDKLVINNYSDRLEMHANIQEVYDYWQANKIAGKDVVFLIRKENDVMSSRGGKSPNRKNVSTLKSSCLLPFCQIVVRPDGKLSLCCNDALGANVLGDLKTQSLVKVWNSERYWKFRNSIRQGRAHVATCTHCDAISESILLAGHLRYFPHQVGKSYGLSFANI